MISTFTLNHFGIVSGTCKELGIADIVDSLIKPDQQQKVTTGQAIVSMILNGLGFSNRRLYLYPQFFENKPIDLLVDNDISADALNDDTIGRALDRVYKYGCTELFCDVASVVTEIEKVDKKFGHLDTTTFSVHGDYKSSDLDAAAIHITYGKSKQRRPDLKQIFLNLLVTSDGGIPLFMQALNGNSSDATTFRKTVTEFKKGLKEHLNEITYWIADCAFYNDQTLRETKDDLLWISRVPETINEAKQLIENLASQLVKPKELQTEKLAPLQEEGYTYETHDSEYGDVDQRWLVIHSDKAENRTKNTVERNVKKEFNKISKATKKIQKTEFESQEGAEKSLEELNKITAYHKIQIDRVTKHVKYTKRGRPSKNQNNEKKIHYHPQCRIEEDKDAINLEIKKRAIFIIATNETSKDNLSDQEVFSSYKGQHKVERGFRFLKDPLFFASSVFLKKPERIVALTMIMCLSLLVYNICERKLRKLLKEHAETIRNQVKKPTQRPTLRWIFQLFEDIHLVKIEESEETRHEVKNLRPDGIKALEILGKNYLEPYLLA